MTNPNNAIGTNAAFGGRTSVNAFNDDLNIYSRGIISGWACSPASGMTVQLGGDGTSRDVAAAEDNAGNKTSINNISGSPVSVTLAAAPATNNRIDAIVAYVDNPATGTATIADNPSACGIIAVSGTTASNPSAPTESQIRSAITADGATGATAYYVVLATIRVGTGVTTIGSGVITQGAKVETGALAGTNTVGTAALQDGSVTSDKVDYATFAHTMETVSQVAVGTSFVTLKTITINNSGLYILDIVSTRGSNSLSGAIIYLQVQKNGSIIKTSTGPTVANYAGNHDPVCNLYCNFEANAGDTIAILTRKDRTDYASNLGCQYTLTQVA